MLKRFIRIIGGKWKKSHISFPEHHLIKPTANRVRETVFNWLQQSIEGAICLDVFAGSGALGLEALSRGVAWVGFIDKSKAVVNSLYLHAKKFNIPQKNYQIYDTSFNKLTREKLLISTPKHLPIDLLFLDPPFNQNLLKKSLLWIENNHFISSNAKIYIECAKNEEIADLLRTHWICLKKNKTQQVSYSLWERVNQ